jgi:UDP-3-O-[3-hydroxymyristoyl] N-acetylglucosamine deacetylase/3-hydroxyacyl-[acyl-carrier-protein] dehydratase
MTLQQTIATTSALEGIGLHKGTPSRLLFRPAESNHGIVFRRMDLPDQPVIPAKLENVRQAHRGTTIGVGNAVVHTVEHVLAAVVGLGIDNIIIEIDGEEPPAGDGSARVFARALHDAGIKSLDEPAQICSLKEVFWVEEQEKMLSFSPSDTFEITFTLDYKGCPALQQTVHLEINEKSFLETIGEARTFGFIGEIESLKAQNLALGGTLANAVVFDQEGRVMNPEGLRDSRECVIHKILDMIGDLALVGKRIKGHFMAYRTGHAVNVKMGKQLCERFAKQTERNASSMMNIDQIKKILPHRYPFLLVDRILSIVPGESAVGIKNVTANEEFFNGHFPEKPVMPGVLIVEAMAQVAGVVFLSQPEHQGKLPFFVGIDRVRFRRPVVPGDRLEFKAKAIKVRSNTGKVEVEARVDSELVSSGELMFTIL